MKYGVIDIGTNSVKLVIGEGVLNDSRTSRKLKILLDVNVVTKLGEGMNVTGRLSDAAIARTAGAVDKFARFAQKNGAEGVICCGTMALRTAQNADEFINAAHALGCPEITVISGEKEAELSACAVIESVDGAKSGEVVIFDTGGGSTEFIRVTDGKIIKATSLPFGAVTLTDERLGGEKISTDVICETVAQLTEKFREEIFASKKCGMLIGTGGNVAAMGAIAAKLDKYDADAVHGSKISLDELIAQTAMFAQCSRDERRSIRGLEPARADIITAGAAIITAAADAAGVKEITVSDRSLRHEILRRVTEDMN